MEFSMSNPECKIKIKMGAVEIEYEGSSDFLKQEMFDLVEAVSKLHNSSVNFGSDDLTLADGSKNNTANISGGKIEGSCNEIAKKLGANGGPDLIFAAAAKLYFVDEKERFSADQIRAEMNSASNYVNTAMKSNFNKNLKSIVRKDRLKDLGSNNYSLSAAEIDEVRAKIV
jgi:hypothetical protein